MTRWRCLLKAALLAVVLLAHGTVGSGQYEPGRAGPARTPQAVPVAQGDAGAVSCPVTRVVADQARWSAGLDGLDVPRPAGYARRSGPHAAQRSRDCGPVGQGVPALTAWRREIHPYRTSGAVAGRSGHVPSNAPLRELLQVFRS